MEIDDEEIQTRYGTTVEGLPCVANCVYPKGAPVGAKAIKIFGNYSSRDGGGHFHISSQGGGVWVDELTGERQLVKNPSEMLPWVVADGTW
jgi:hypothetical protein